MIVTLGPTYPLEETAEALAAMKEGRVRQAGPHRVMTIASDEAQEWFLRAIEVARRQSAKSLELRAVTSLSRLWQRQGKRDDARTLLATTHDWFTEGLDTKDLQEARALLEMLS